MAAVPLTRVSLAPARKSGPEKRSSPVARLGSPFASSPHWMKPLWCTTPDTVSDALAVYGPKHRPSFGGSSGPIPTSTGARSTTRRTGGEGGAGVGAGAGTNREQTGTARRADEDTRQCPVGEADLRIGELRLLRACDRRAGLRLGQRPRQRGDAEERVRVCEVGCERATQEREGPCVRCIPRGQAVSDLLGLHQGRGERRGLAAERGKRLHACGERAEATVERVLRGGERPEGGSEALASVGVVGGGMVSSVVVG